MMTLWGSRTSLAVLLSVTFATGAGASTFVFDGAYGIGCDCTLVNTVEETSWGRIKSLYR